MAERKLLGQHLSYEDRIHLAQLTNLPGWPVLVKLMAESCRNATEEVIKLDPTTTERYSDIVAALQMTARAINKFSAEVLDSVKVHQRTAVLEAQEKEKPRDEVSTTRFQGFNLPVPQSPEGK